MLYDLFRGIGCSHEYYQVATAKKNDYRFSYNVCKLCGKKRVLKRKVSKSE